MKNQHQIVIFFRIEDKDSQSIRIEAAEELDYKNKLNKTIVKELRH